MKVSEPIKKLSSINKEKRESLGAAIKQLTSFLKASQVKLKNKESGLSTQDFTAQYCIHAEQVKKIAMELAATEQVEFALLRDENLTNKITR